VSGNSIFSPSHTANVSCRRGGKWTIRRPRIMDGRTKEPISVHWHHGKFPGKLPRRDPRTSRGNITGNARNAFFHLCVGRSSGHEDTREGERRSQFILKSR
jgi:hypothetical protein